jgi:hypothetical protein
MIGDTLPLRCQLIKLQQVITCSAMSYVPSIRYLSRIISALAVNGELSITNLAMQSRVNHLRCRAVVDWLQFSGYVNVVMRDNRRIVALTETGLSYSKRVFELGDVTNPAIRKH